MAASKDGLSVTGLTTQPKNWRTTTLGVLLIIGAVCSFLTAVLDTDPTTTPDFMQVWGAIIGSGFILTKDAKVK